MSSEDRRRDAPLAVRGLAASYDGWPLFGDISVTVRPGECLVLAEENDVVRTAFLQTVAGLRDADSGLVAAGRVRAVWHADGLPEDTPVEQSVATLLPGTDPRALLGEIGLEHRASHEPWAMSAGERRRVALAIAFADPAAELLLLDEPERGLDAAAIAWVGEQITARLRDGVSAVVATFDERIAALADLELTLQDS